MTPSQIAQANPPGSYKECVRRQEYLLDLANQVEQGTMAVLRNPDSVAPLQNLSQIAHNIRQDANTNFDWVKPDPGPSGTSGTSGTSGSH